MLLEIGVLGKEIFHLLIVAAGDNYSAHTAVPKRVDKFQRARKHGIDNFVFKLVQQPVDGFAHLRL